MNRKAHNFVTRQLFGSEYAWVHEVKDLPVRSLGFKHRAAMHDHETAILLALLSQDLQVYVASIIHDVCDWAARERKRKNIKKVLYEYT